MFDIIAGVGRRGRRRERSRELPLVYIYNATVVIFCTLKFKLILLWYGLVMGVFKKVEFVHNLSKPLA